MKTGNGGCPVLTAITVALFSGVCFAFNDTGFQYWSKAGVSTNINKDWKFTFEEEFKLGDDGGNLYSRHSDVGFVYKGLADWVELGFNYRYVSEKGGKDDWRRERRPHMNITLKGQLFGLGVSNRSRFEYRNREKKKDLWRYRNKVTLKLPLELTKLKLQPYLADEVFFNFDAEGYNKNRLYSGVSFDLSKNLKGDIFYIWQVSRSGGDHKEIHVLGNTLKLYF